MYILEAPPIKARVGLKPNFTRKSDKNTEKFLPRPIQACPHVFRVKTNFGRKSGRNVDYDWLKSWISTEFGKYWFEKVLKYFQIWRKNCFAKRDRCVKMAAVVAILKHANISICKMTGKM